MKTKTVLSLVASSFLLLACADANHYPITGAAIGADDQVKHMVVSDVTPR